MARTVYNIRTAHSFPPSVQEGDIVQLTFEKWNMDRIIYRMIGIFLIKEIDPGFNECKCPPGTITSLRVNLIALDGDWSAYEAIYNVSFMTLPIMHHEILTVKDLPLFIGYKRTTPLLEQLIKG